MKRRTALALAGASMAGLAAPRVLRAQQGTLIRLGFNPGANSPHAIGSQVLADRVAAGTSGRYRVQLFPAGALGNEVDGIQGVQLGTIDMYCTSTAPVGNVVPETLIIDIPFLFRDLPHARGVLDGAIGQELLDAMPARGLIGLGWAENGFRHIMANRPIVTAADMRGAKIRSQNNPIHMSVWRALGAQPTFINFTELYAATQTGVIDTNEQPIPVFVSARFHEIQKHMTMTSHFYSPNVFLMSPATWRRIPAADQAIFRDAAVAGGRAMRTAVDDQDRTGVETMRAAGVTIQPSFDRASFEAAMAPLMPDFVRRFGEERIARIRNFRPSA